MTTLLPEDTLGVKEYGPPTVTLLGGTPCRRIWVLAVPVPAGVTVPVTLPGELTLELPVELPPPLQPARLAARSNPRMKRFVIFREPR